MFARNVSLRSPLKLAPEHVDLWYTRTDQVAPELASQYQALLTAQELIQYSRFYFEKDRHRYLVTRALVREVLSRYAPVAPEVWRFEADRYGKPFVVNPTGVARQITFNISHTDGLVVLGIRLSRALGVDIESTAREAPLSVSEQFFAAAERRDLCSLPPLHQPMRFWELWTLKESYVKARGMGLSLPLDQFSFDLTLSSTVSVQFAPGFEDMPSRWQFWLLRPTVHHLLSVCVETPGLDDLPIRLNVREIVPQSFHRLVHCPIYRFPQTTPHCSTNT